MKGLKELMFSRRKRKQDLSSEEKTQCLKDPLCDWSWFEDRCSCEKNPCDTLYCYPDANKTDQYCACSMLLCQWNWTSDACFVYTGIAGSICICKTSFEYPQFTSQENLTDSCLDSPCETSDPLKAKQLPKDFLEALSMLKTTQQITELLKKLRSSRTDDVKDVERFFVPSVSVVDNYGSPADSFILSCSYGPERCEHLLTLYSPTYGKCYMFNYVGKENEKKPEVKVAKQAGREHGLQLYMQARKKDAVALLTKQLGVRIVIHDPRSIPIASENGIDVRPGDMVSMSVEYIEINRLGPPWGECASDNESLPSNYSADPYIQTHCEKHCVGLEFYRRCKCYHPMFLAATVIPQRGVICPTNDSQGNDACVYSVMMDNAAGKIKCSCPPPCREKHYHTTTSSSRLNPDFFQLVKKAKSLTIKNGTATVIHPDYEFSLMGVQIYYNSFFVTYVNETAIYSWESLIANIGGNMGLFLGLSIVTLLEITEFLAEMMTRCITQRGTAKIRDKIIVRTF
ncbi:amiloride-sensitive sodium channel subunit beta-like [Stegodyphus dumicola]|uniref:amiloride-sensitive sodium channel subunit beta-like n=1 Tax=Stegodyphus dumicola TaxID=202533 RepID=UPI0015A8D431|nr:amiloride-sensitive sodium channel subunit beta-like [Stegodyphus dumicola]